MSINIFAGIAIKPSSLDSTVNFVLIVVSRSEANIVRSEPEISNRKLSKIGRVLFELRTPLIKESCLSKEALETIKFMLLNLSTYKDI